MNPDQSDTKAGILPIAALVPLARTRLVKLVNNAGAPAVTTLETPDDIPYGYTAEAAGEAGDPVDIAPLDPLRNHRLRLTGACLPGDVLVADGGNVQALPDPAAQAADYVRIGIAEEAGEDGQLVLLRPHLTGLRITVPAAS
jgi:hypothetical protein